MAEKIKVRVLVEQGRPHRDGYIASGDVVSLDTQRAKEMLDLGLAEPVAEKRASRAEKRPAGSRAESR